MLTSLEGRVALITGAARGQGRTHALRLAEEGADILMFDICSAIETVGYEGATPADLEETARLIREVGRRTFYRTVDARDLAAVTRFVDDGVTEFGRLDIAVINHGICGYGYTWELSEAQWDEMIAVNLTGVWKVLKAVVPPMMEQRGGSIIITSSVAGLRGLPFLAHYSASKHGVVGLARTLAHELGQYNIRVNTIHPAGVRTVMGGFDAEGNRRPGSSFNGLLDDPQVAAVLGPVFMNTLPEPVVEPDDVADTVVFLAADVSRYITGAQIPVDLGALIR